MRGLWQHFRLTLLLNCKSRQALIYGYLVPVFFLIAFGSIFRSATPPLIRQLGQLLTITVLGGACFGMPTAIVAERERGIWRRYRLLPMASAWLLVSTMAARVLIVLSAAVLQIALAGLMYGMPMPAHPAQLILAFLFVTFAFLGLGLIIAMLAQNVPAVQALGQAIFLPMIMIGGVGVPLWTLPEWAQRLAGYLPGKYAVESLQMCATGPGLSQALFDLAALTGIGFCACLAGARMFRWDAQEKADPRKKRWLVLALAGWLAVGITADVMHRPRLLADMDPNAAGATSYQSITQAQIEAIKYDHLPSDDQFVTPIARNLRSLNDQGLARMAEFRAQLAAWPPARDADPVRRVRNMLDAAGVFDIAQDRYEDQIAYVVLETLRHSFSPEDLQKMLAWIILHPHDESPIVGVPELGCIPAAMPQDVNERAAIYATKLLGRLTGKIHAGPE